MSPRRSHESLGSGILKPGCLSFTTIGPWLIDLGWIKWFWYKINALERMSTLWNYKRTADFLPAREDIGDRMSAKWSRSGNLPWRTSCPQEKDPIQIRIEWNFNFTLNHASSVETPQWMMSYCPRSFWSLNPVLRTADSLDMKKLPSVYTAYVTLSIATYQSVFGSALGLQIYCLSRRPVYRSSALGTTFCDWL
jgi:hypothetical protein